jgi:hypothetical protein
MAEKKITLELGSTEVQIILTLLEKGKGVEYTIDASRVRVSLYDRLITEVKKAVGDETPESA